MNLLIAPDSFKGSLTSREAGEAIARGFARVFPDADLTVLPLADGGEGTVDALVSAVGGEILSADAPDPLLRMRTACENNTAVLRIVSAEAFPLDPHITVTAFRGRSVAFCTLSDDPQEGFCREYTLRDAMLANRLADYMSNLKDSSLVCTQRYTLEYIDFCLRLL